MGWWADRKTRKAAEREQIKREVYANKVQERVEEAVEFSRKPKHKGEAVGKYTGGTWVWKKIIQPIIVGILVGITLLIVGFIIFALFNIGRSGTGGALYTKGTVLMEQTGVGSAILKGIESTFNIVLHPERLMTDYKWESDVEKNVDNKMLGVSVKDFKPTGQQYNSNEMIEAWGTVTATSLDEDMILRINCEMDDYEKEVFVYLPREYENEINPGEQMYTVKKGQTETLTVKCVFPEGYEVNAGLLNKEFEEKIIRLTVKYDFTTNAYLKLYMLNPEKLNYLQSNRWNPFVYYEISDPQLSIGDRTVKSKSTYGPLSIGIGVGYTQPVTTGLFYELGINLNDNGWKGKTVALKGLDLQLNPNFELGQSGDFVATVLPEQDDGYKTYKLKESTLYNVNNRCSVEQLTKKQCKEIEGKFDMFKTSFKINDEIATDQMYYSSIRAKADYVFETSGVSSVTVLEQKALETNKGVSLV